VRLLLGRLQSLSQVRTDWEPHRFERAPTRLIDFDDQYTAPRSGFRDAADYYERCSSEQFLPAIQVPTLLLTSRDDPMIPSELFRRAQLSLSTQLHVAHGGGHLGYLGRSGLDPDGRWLDWRVVDWVCGAKSQDSKSQ
jgi:predicted alpha/beta-fold hydrolase